MINRPDNLAWYIGIFLAVTIGISFLIADADIIAEQKDTIHKDYYENIELLATSDTGLLGASVDVSSSLSTAEGSSSLSNEENILKQGFNSMLKLGKTFNAVKKAASESSATLGIDPIFIVILLSMLMISFGVVLYTWIRGR